MVIISYIVRLYCCLKKNMYKGGFFSYVMRLLYAFNKFIFFLFVTGFFVNNVYSQCDPPFDIPFSLVELDSTINYTFTSSVTGVDFIQPLYLNLPLCPEYAEEGAGCTQVELPTVDYNGLGLGYSGAFLQVFW